MQDLQVIIKESGLEKTKAQVLLDNFSGYFQLASEWETKAKTIKVTDASQEADMKMARIGRLELREKRLHIEKTRKELKEQSLREGKAIDGIANVLKSVIVPIEQYLEKQEKFVEIQEEKKKEAIRIEIEKKTEEEIIAKEKAEAEERERIRLENERLKIEAQKREENAKAEREEHEKVLAQERAKAEAERKKQEDALRLERQKAEAEKRKQEAELLRQKEESERKQKEAEAKAKAEQDRIKKEAEAKAEAERLEKEKLQEKLKNLIECPNCGHKFTRQ